jgi:hypothetical protein
MLIFLTYLAVILFGAALIAAIADAIEYRHKITHRPYDWNRP